MRRLRKLLRPLLRTATMLWLWQNRHQMASLFQFALDVPRRLRNGERADVVTEARLRAKLAADPRTRTHRDLIGTVRDGVVAVDAHEDAGWVASDIARRTPGVKEVEVSTSPVVRRLIEAGADDLPETASSSAKLAL